MKIEENSILTMKVIMVSWIVNCLLFWYPTPSEYFFKLLGGHIIVTIIMFIGLRINWKKEQEK